MIDTQKLPTFRLIFRKKLILPYPTIYFNNLKVIPYTCDKERYLLSIIPPIPPLELVQLHTLIWCMDTKEQIITWLNHPCKSHEQARIYTHGCRNTFAYEHVSNILCAYALWSSHLIDLMVGHIQWHRFIFFTNISNTSALKVKGKVPNYAKWLANRVLTQELESMNKID